MTVTLDELVERVNFELENVLRRGSATAEGDGEATSFLVGPIGYTIVDDDAWQVAIDGTLTSAYTMNYDNGVCTFNEAPSDGAEILWNFNYVAFTDELIEMAINAGIQNIFPSFYIWSSTEATADGEDYEFQLPAGTEFLTGVDVRTDTSDPWIKRKRDRWDVYDDGTNKILRFFTAPSAGYIRARTISRPSAISGSDDLSDAGLPDRAADPIVSYACYYLLVQKMAPRVRTDVAIATQGKGTVFPTQMNLAAQAFMMRFQFQLASVKMPPWSIE